MTDNGHIQPALELAHLLLERSELSNPIRQEIERFIGNPPPAWILEIERYIHRQQPFQYNWFLRLDRIPSETAIAPIKGKWHQELASILVEIHLLGELSLAYKTKQSQDVVNEMLPEVPPVRRVVRKVNSTFWFFREVLRYAEDCVIVSPETVRTRYRDKVQRMMQHY